MKYISLGAVMEPSTEHIVKVSHCGIDYTLTQELASLWLDGRFGFAEAESPIEMRALNQLYRMGLVVTADESDAGEYRALTHCRAVPVKRKNPYAGLAGDEKTIMIWLREAGLLLTMAELVFLMDRQVQPELSLLGQETSRRWLRGFIPARLFSIMFWRIRWSMYPAGNRPSEQFLLS